MVKNYQSEYQFLQSLFYDKTKLVILPGTQIIYTLTKDMLLSFSTSIVTDILGW